MARTSAVISSALLGSRSAVTSEKQHTAFHTAARGTRHVLLTRHAQCHTSPHAATQCKVAESSAKATRIAATSAPHVTRTCARDPKCQNTNAATVARRQSPISGSTGDVKVGCGKRQDNTTLQCP
eukprot:gene10260-biopygen1648